MKDLKDVKQQVLDYSKYGYENGMFAGTSGNLSICDRETGYVVITPSNIPYVTMELDDIMVITLSGEIIEGKHSPSSEWQLHTEIYKGKQEVSAIVHTHSPYATAFSVTREEIPVILIEMVPFLGGAIPVAPFALPGTKGVGEGAVSVLKSNKGCLLANHGALATGANILEAYKGAEYVEDAGKIYYFARTMGQAKFVPEEAVTAMKKQFGYEV